MSRSLRVLCIHGVGGHPPAGRWQKEWSELIRGEIQRHNPRQCVEVGFVCYDDLFECGLPSRGELVKALRILVGSGVFPHSEGRLFQERAGSGGLAHLLNLTAGMVIQWAGNGELRAHLRQRVIERTEDFQPDVVAAHSLGSLIAYDAFSRPDGAGSIRGRVFLSFGSQIGHRFVRGVFAGQLRPLDAAMWYHLHNPRDPVFTSPLRFSSPNFRQVITRDLDGWDEHAARGYLQHPQTAEHVWKPLASKEFVPNLLQPV